MTQQGSTPSLSFLSLSSPCRYKPPPSPAQPFTCTFPYTFLHPSEPQPHRRFCFPNVERACFPRMPPQTDDDDWSFQSWCRSLQSGSPKIVWVYLAQINELKLFYTTAKIQPSHCHHHFRHLFPFLSPHNLKLHTASGRQTLIKSTNNDKIHNNTLQLLIS